MGRTIDTMDTFKRIAKSRMIKKPNDRTRPTPVRQDAPLRNQGRSERRGEAYFGLYVEPLSDVRTQLAGFLDILLVVCGALRP
jgi:hypothetical protein